MKEAMVLIRFDLLRGVKVQLSSSGRMCVLLLE